MLRRIKHLLLKIAQRLLRYRLSYAALLQVVRLLPATTPHQSEPWPRLLGVVQALSATIRGRINTLPLAEREAIARQYLIPAINLLFDKNRVNWAQILLFSVEEFFLAQYTEESFEAVLQTFSAHAIAAGERFRAHAPLPAPTPAQSVRLGFVAPYVAISGYEVIQGLGPSLVGFAPKLLAMRAFDAAVGSRCKEYFQSGGIELITANSPVYDVFALRHLLVAHPVDVAIWPLPPFHMFFLFSFGLAQRQVWFSQYLHPALAVPHLHATLTPAGAGTLRQKLLNGQTWNVIPQLSRPHGAYTPPPQKVLFTPARLEKLKQPEFLECVAQILKSEPQAHFKWTGYYHDQEVVDFFSRHGLYSRQRYLPWLNQEQLVEEIKTSDLILSSFPLALGTVENIAAHQGIPVVTLYDLEKNLYWRDIYWEACNGNAALREMCFDAQGQSRILIAKTPDEYVAAALRLLREPELVKLYTDVYRKTFDYTYTNNPNDVGAILTDFIKGVVAETDTTQGAKNVMEEKGPDLLKCVV